MSYYKTNHPSVIAAWDKYHADKQDLLNRGRVFAGSFGGTPVLSFSSNGSAFHGVSFKIEKPISLWTSPNADRLAKTQRPRHSLKKATSEERAEHAALVKQWNDGFKAGNLNQTVSRDPLYSSIGTDWGASLFGGGLNLFSHGGWVYIKTNQKLNDAVTEILGSEYLSAEKAFNDAVKQPKAEQL